MVVAVATDQPGEALPRVATAKVALDFPGHEARKGSVCALDNRLEFGESVAHEAMQQVAGGVAALDGNRHGARPCSNRAGGVERSKQCGGLDEAGTLAPSLMTEEEKGGGGVDGHWRRNPTP